MVMPPHRYTAQTSSPKRPQWRANAFLRPFKGKCIPNLMRRPSMQPYWPQGSASDSRSLVIVKANTYVPATMSVWHALPALFTLLNYYLTWRRDSQHLAFPLAFHSGAFVVWVFDSCVRLPSCGGHENLSGFMACCLLLATGYKVAVNTINVILVLPMVGVCMWVLHQ